MQNTRGLSRRMVFAAPPYLNTAPLIEGMDHRDDVEVVRDVPSTLANYVKERKADAGLVPVADYMDDPQLTMIDGLGICADGKVDSVLLRSRRDLTKIRTLALDAASHTSNLLAQLVLRAHCGCEPAIQRTDDHEQPDARVIIGDRALSAQSAGAGDYDLAELWKAMTGLPFVFAVWAYRRDNPCTDSLRSVALDAYTVGEGAIDEIAARFSRGLDIPENTCQAYLRHRIYHTVGEREKQALSAFDELLEKHALPRSAILHGHNE